jgi:hypothetical protein
MMDFMGLPALFRLWAGANGLAPPVINMLAEVPAMPL